MATALCSLVVSIMCCIPKRAGLERALVGTPGSDEGTGCGDAGQLPRDGLFPTFLAAILPGPVAKKPALLTSLDSMDWFVFLLA